MLLSGKYKIASLVEEAKATMASPAKLRTQYVNLHYAICTLPNPSEMLIPAKLIAAETRGNDRSRNDPSLVYHR